MIAEVAPTELDAWAEAQATRKPLVLDVREPWELQAASIPADAGWEFVAIPMNDVPQRLAQLDPERPIAVLCHHGVRSLRVAIFLAEQGYEHVVNIAGGIAAWADERDASVGRY